MAEKRSGARGGLTSRNHPRPWRNDDPIPRTVDGIDARIFRPGQPSAQPATSPEPPVEEDNATRMASLRHASTSWPLTRAGTVTPRNSKAKSHHSRPPKAHRARHVPVSYTHLTLPTICSV